jgi:hypothetical protein
LGVKFAWQKKIVAVEVLDKLAPRRSPAGLASRTWTKPSSTMITSMGR